MICAASTPACRSSDLVGKSCCRASSNAHHHVGLTPLQLGSPDMPLELWFVTRMVARNVNPYLDTLYFRL